MATAKYYLSVPEKGYQMSKSPKALSTGHNTLHIEKQSLQ
jgi:hypothetical protein